MFLVLRAHRIKGTFPENRNFGQVLCDFRKGHSFSTQILMHGPQLRAHFRKYWYDATSTALPYGTPYQYQSYGTGDTMRSSDRALRLRV